MISGTNDMNDRKETKANILCKSCGLCCTGHLFIWAKLRPGELDSAEALGMKVFRSDPNQRGFSQPCPLWQGQCTIHNSPHYPRVCRAYKCKLLKKVIGDVASLSDALRTIEQAKAMIGELEGLLPASKHVNFRERLVAQLETRSGPGGPAEPEFRQKAEALLAFYEEVFAVDDLVERE
jgi:hypothetical protein